MNCCICGDPIEDGDYVLRLNVYRFLEAVPSWTLLASKFEDGTPEKFSHLSCPVLAGAPMSLIGAEGGRVDDDVIEF